MKRICLKLSNPAMEDFAEEWLWADGALSVSSLPAHAEDRVLEALYPACDPAELAQKLSQAAVFWPKGAWELDSAEVDQQDWQVKWRENFNPMQVGSFRLVGEWEGEPPDEKTILIYPGQAFGTGQHETTQLILQYLEQQDLSGKNVLDIGCGTGILSIAAEKLGAGQVFGFDNDPDCSENMHHHLRINQSSRTTLKIGTLDGFEASPYAIILANITLNVLREVWPALATWTAADSLLISSGILAEQEAEARELLRQSGFEILHRSQSGEWIMLAARPA